MTMYLIDGNLNLVEYVAGGYSAGAGIEIVDGVIGHVNSVTAKTTYVGSGTSVPRIKYDEYGHITATTTATIYPPTTAGTSGQYWKSDGAGAGSWQTPDDTPTEGSVNAITSGAVYTALAALEARVAALE